MAMLDQFLRKKKTKKNNSLTCPVSDGSCKKSKANKCCFSVWTVYLKLDFGDKEIEADFQTWDERTRKV